jgi:hypothetical protein
MVIRGCRGERLRRYWLKNTEFQLKRRSKFNTSVVQQWLY